MTDAHRTHVADRRVARPAGRSCGGCIRRLAIAQGRLVCRIGRGGDPAAERVTHV